MENNTYTLAIGKPGLNGIHFEPVKDIPCNMTKLQAEAMAQKARDNGLNVVAFNTKA